MCHLCTFSCLVNTSLPAACFAIVCIHVRDIGIAICERVALHIIIAINACVALKEPVVVNHC